MARNASLAVLAALAVTAFAGPALAQYIPLRSNINMTVGQTVVVKGVRADCGQPAPPLRNLPRSALGTFSSGNVGTVNSRSCGGPTPARELRFTARRAGTETLVVFEDTVTITVR